MKIISIVAALLGTAASAGLRVELERAQQLVQTKESVQHLFGSPEGHTFTELRSLQRYHIHSSRQELLEMQSIASDQSLVQTNLKSKKLNQLKGGKSSETDLDNWRDASYIGTLYLGTPQSQPVRLIFDTGSEYFAVTS